MTLEQEFGDLYQTHYAYVHKVCLRIVKDPTVAEDCAQDTFLRAWKAFPRFEKRAQFRTWLHRIAWNASVEMIKRGKGPIDAAPIEDVEIGREASAETSLALRDALDRLTPMIREAVLLQHGFGNTAKEIARDTGASASAIKSRVHHGVTFLRKDTWLSPVFTRESSIRDKQQNA